MNIYDKAADNPRSGFRIAGTVSVAALILSWVALLNDHPLLFDDTLGYLRDGMNLVRLKWPDNNLRSVFYGLAIWFLHLERTLWPVVLAQGLVLAHVIWLTLRVQGIELRPDAFLGLVILLAVATPVSWYVAHVLPDVFLGVLILGAYLLGFCRDRLNRVETAYLFLLVTASICFHLTYPVVAIVLAAACAVAWIAKPQLRTMINPVLLIAALALALTAFYSFSLVVYKRLSLTPNSPPHLLARMLADGESKAYLRVVCPQKSYALCPFLTQLPETERQFLWTFLITKPELWNVVRNEEGSIVLGTVRMFPALTARNVIANTFRQLVTFGSSAELRDNSRVRLMDELAFAGRGYPGSLQGRGLLSARVMGTINGFHAVIVVFSLMLAVYFGIRCVLVHEHRRVSMALVVALGLVVNAFACGAFSGVFGHFEGRGIWLIPFCAIVLMLATDTSRTRSTKQRTKSVAGGCGNCERIEHERRRLVGARHGVVHEAATQHLTVRVVNHFLAKRA